MPDGSSKTVIFHASLSSLLKLFPSLTFTSRKRSSRGDDNLEQAEIFLQITEKQLIAIYSASQQATNGFAKEITKIEFDLDQLKPWLNALKKARESQSGLKHSFQRLSSDSVTKDIRIAARELSRKAKRTSAQVAANEPSRAKISSQIASSSEYSVVPNNELTAYTNLSGIGLSFDRQPTTDDTKKIEDIIHPVDPDVYSDDDSTAASVRTLRSWRSDVSSYYYHYRGPDAYNTGESRGPSCDTSGQLSPQPRTSTGMHLGYNNTFRHCTFINMQAYDNGTVPDATLNLGVDATRRDLLGVPPLPSAGHGSPCPSSDASRDAEAIQDNDISLQDAAVENTQSVPEKYDPPVNMQPVSQAETGLGEGATRQASPLTMAGTQNAKSHSLIASGSAMVFSPTMNFKSPGATGATNTYLSTRPAHSPPPQASAQNRHSEGWGSNCMTFTDDSVAYNPTFNDESPGASGAYNQEIPAAGSSDPFH